MGVRFFSCESCKSPASEYNEIFCEGCEGHLCGCAIPEELSPFIRIWEDIWEFVDTDEKDNLIPRSEDYEEKAELINRFLTYNSNTYGLVLKKDFCPICNKGKENRKDPEYEEYLRLKKKFER